MLPLKDTIRPGFFCFLCLHSFFLVTSSLMRRPLPHPRAADHSAHALRGCFVKRMQQQVVSRTKRRTFRSPNEHECTCFMCYHKTFAKRFFVLFLFHTPTKSMRRFPSKQLPRRGNTPKLSIINLEANGLQFISKLLWPFFLLSNFMNVKRKRKQGQVKCSTATCCFRGAVCCSIARCHRHNRAAHTPSCSTFDGYRYEIPPSHIDFL